MIIQPFDASTITGFSTLIVGTRRMGKSTLVKDIMYHNRDKFDVGAGISKHGYEMSEYMPSKWVSETFDKDVVDNLMVEMLDDIEKQGCFIMEDLDILKPAMQAKVMNTHLPNLTSVYTLHYLNISDRRAHIDYVFASRVSIVDQRKRLWKRFFTMFLDYESFSEAYDECTKEPWGFMVADTRTGAVFSYTASPDTPPFQLAAV